MGDVELPLRLSSVDSVADCSRGRAVDPSPARCQDPLSSPTSKPRFKFFRIFNSSSRDREHPTNRRAGSSKKRWHRFSLFFTVFGMKRSTRGGSGSARGGGDSDNKVQEKSASISDGIEVLSRSTIDSSCFSLHDEEVCHELRSSFSTSSLRNEEACHELRASFYVEKEVGMFNDIKGDGFESCIRLIDHSAVGSEEMVLTPISASLERLEIEEVIDVAEDKDECGRKEISTVTERRIVRREMILKELKLPQFSSLLAPALLSYVKNKMARKISSVFTLNHDAWRMNLDMKKLLLGALAARRRLIANESRPQLCDKKILMGKRCQALDFTDTVGEENSMQLIEWPGHSCDDKGLMQVIELQTKAVAWSELSVQVVAPPVAPLPVLPPPIHPFVVGDSFREE